MENPLPADWGVPDWRDASAYPGACDLTDHVWRWQFIRRMPEYREAWDRAAIDEYRMCCRLRGDVNKVLTPDSPYFRVSTAAYDHPLEFDGLLNYSLGSFPNPRIMLPTTLPGGPTLLHFNDEDGGSTLVGWKSEFRTLQHVNIRPGWTAINFNLAQPLAPQIERATRQLQCNQSNFHQVRRDDCTPDLRQKTRQHKHLWPRYLRVLDARNLNVSYREIGLVLHGIDPDVSAEGQSLQQFDRRLAEVDRAQSDAKKWHMAALKVAPKTHL